MIGNFIFSAYTVTILTKVLATLNVLGFMIFILGNESIKIISNKIFKFIEPFGVMYGGLFLLIGSSGTIGVFYFGFVNNFSNFIFYSLLFLFIIINWSGIVSYFILRFLPIPKLTTIQKKWHYYSILSAIIANIIFTLLCLIFSFSFGVLGLLPVSASLLYFKTLLITKDKF